MRLSVTNGGRAVARSGLLPRSADELIGYVSRNAAQLVDLATQCSDTESANSDDFAFVMIHAAFSCSEYGGRDLGAKRFLPYQLIKSPLSGPQTRVRRLMFAPIEDGPLNASILATRWVGGANIRDIESVFDIRSGALQSMFSEASNILRGLSDILYAITAPQEDLSLPSSLNPNSCRQITEIIGSIRRLAMRLDAGLPEEVVWMTTLLHGGSPLLGRQQIMELKASGFLSPEHILDTGKFPALMAVFGRGSAQITTLAQNLQTSVRNWKLEERQRLMESQERRLPAECRDLIRRYYRSREKEFELCIEEAFECLGIVINGKDDGSSQSFPDFVAALIPSKSISIECKSKLGSGSVTFNDATDVIRKASVNGLDKSFKVTVCQPYISPDVTRNLTKCTELCVVNAEDFAEGLVRLKVGRISLADFADWLQRPGQAVRDMLPASSNIPRGESPSDMKAVGS